MSEIERIGHSCPAGNKRGEIYFQASQVAQYFSVPFGSLAKILQFVETAAEPNIVLVQHCEESEDCNLRAITFFPSVWSTAYARFGTPYGKVHRDYHYQCLFLAISTLVEVGCTRNRIGSPMPGYLWRRDAYVCLLEANRNIQKNMNLRAQVNLEPGSYYAPMVDLMDRRRDEFDMQEHRPVGVHMHIVDGFNIRRVFVETADEIFAARKSSSNT